MTVNTKKTNKKANKIKGKTEGLTAAEVRELLKSYRKTWIQSRIEDTQAALSQNLPTFQPFGSIECTDAISMMQGIPDGFADAIITDPPYGVGMAKWDANVPGSEVWREAFRVLGPGGFCVVAAAPRTAHLTAMALADAGFEIRDMIVWNYTQSFPGAQLVDGEWRSGLKTNQEPWVVAQKPLEKGLTLVENWGIHRLGAIRTGANGSGNWQTNVIKCAKPKARDRNLGAVPGKAYATPPSKKSGAWSNNQGQANNHPTAKPLALMRKLVTLFTPDKGVVVDPFMGSGSTLVAAAAEGHAVFGSDMEFGYWDLACDRVDWAYANPHLVPKVA